MGKQDFDNLYKVLNVGSIFTGATLVSLEVDFELPRGFIAKIWRVELNIIAWADDFKAISADKNATWQLALIRDPDDITTVVNQSNSVQHDVVIAREVGILIVAGTAGDPGSLIGRLRNELDIPPHVDLVTARNMRFNCVASDDDAADITESVAECNIFYTLEKITDADILEILDIL